MKSKDLDDTLGQCRKRRQADHQGKQQSQEFCKLAPVGMDPSQQPTAIKSLIMQMVGLNQATQSSNSIKNFKRKSLSTWMLVDGPWRSFSEHLDNGIKVSRSR